MFHFGVRSPMPFPSKLAFLKSSDEIDLVFLSNVFWIRECNSAQGRGGSQGRPRGGSGGRGFGRGRGRGRGRGEKVSAEDLDADLEKYHSEAMQINWRASHVFYWFGFYVFCYSLCVLDDATTLTVLCISTNILLLEGRKEVLVGKNR